MKKVLMAVAVAVMFCSMAFAGYKEGVQMCSDKKYAEAITELQKALPELKGVDKSNAQLHIGYSFYNQKKYDEAITEYRKVAGIEGAHPYHVSTAQVMIGRITKDNAEYAKVVKIKGAYINHIIEALGITGVMTIWQRLLLCR